MGTRRRGIEWAYTVVQDSTRAVCYFDREASFNKTFFDALHLQQRAIEGEFGGELEWQRSDDHRSSRISAVIPGGWADENAWPATIEAAVDAMARLHKTFAPRIKEALKSEA